MYIIYINIYKGDSFGLQNTRVLNVLTTTACSVLSAHKHNTQSDFAKSDCPLCC